ncbi:hypothetical protein [Streptomyces sp. NPDC050560]|uniref:hypothetical protein n=1 Tax=Streptomyces sp. NPDC050560 TaxID=3365630 RepID=UPI00378FD77C
MTESDDDFSPAADSQDLPLDSGPDDFPSESASLAPELASLAPELESDTWQDWSSAADLSPDITTDGLPE